MRKRCRSNRFVYRGSITSMVEGSGVARAKESASITLTAGGKVLDVYVSEGDFVHKGDPLYRIDSTDAEAALTAAQKTLSNYEKELNALYDAYDDLTIKAPYTGKLLDVKKFSVGDDVSVGTPVATLVDDAKMRLTQYFSYAYEDSISVGQTVQVSVPAAMAVLPGKVEEVNKVKRIAPEGSVLFAVKIILDNPGTLTEKMSATAVLKSGGEEIYPYEAGSLEYNRTTTITAKVAGPVEWVGLLDYAEVSAGQVLLRLGSEDYEEQIASKELQVQKAREDVEDAAEALGKFNAVAPIDGTVLSLSISIGQEVAQGTTVVNIANTNVMMVDAQVDERNINYVKAGMYVDLDQWGTPYGGIVDSVSMEGKYENGVSYFPAVITVDNPDGTMMSGSYVTYRLVASQSDDCLLLPIQCVKYVDMGGQTGTVVFLKGPSRPENAVDLESVEVPDGFYAVPVTVGISDTTNVEIKEGLQEGDEVFTQYLSQSAYMSGMVMKG